MMFKILLQIFKLLKMTFARSFILKILLHYFIKSKIEKSIIVAKYYIIRAVPKPNQKLFIYNYRITKP
jgi:hypothetical protein